MRIVTIGVYGWDEEPWLEAVRQAGLDVFVDTRRRRGVRGSQYAFANSARLQANLAALGIPYIHSVELAPSNATRQGQERADVAGHIRRRDRAALTPEFVAAYEREVLDGFDSRTFVESLGNPASILLFCVEGAPEACHRSLLAGRLARDLGATVEHLVP